MEPSASLTLVIEESHTPGVLRVSRFLARGLRMRLLSVIAAGILFCWSAVAWAEGTHPQDRLDKAMSAYNVAREKAVRPVEKLIRDRIELARNKGDLDTKKELEAALEGLLQGNLPSLKILDSSVRTAERELNRGKNRLLLEFQDVEREYVKKGDDASAEEVRAERTELERRLGETVAIPADRRKAPQPQEQPGPATPAATDTASVIFLSDLREQNPSTAAVQFQKNGFIGGNINKPMTVRGKVANKGLLLCPQADGRSSVTYDVPEGCVAFKAFVGVDDGCAERHSTGGTALVFKVLCGENVIWKSQPIRGVGAIAECNCPLADCGKVTLVVECPGTNNCAHAVWFDPCFVRK